MIQVSLKYSEVPAENNSALVQVMAWNGTDDKSLLEPMMNRFMFIMYIRVFGQPKVVLFYNTMTLFKYNRH